jgi:hypothetical protein
MTMKKFLALFLAILFVGVLSFSLMSFRDDGPKKAKSEKSCAKADTTAACSHKGEADKTCCKESGKKCAHEGSKSEKCEHHQEAEKK